MTPSCFWISRRLRRSWDADLDVEGAEGLVEQEHRRLVDQGAGEGDPLLLAARELMGVAVAEAAEADAVEQLLAPAGALGRRHFADLQWELDVLAHAHVAEDRVVLEDEADPPRLRRQVGDVAVAQPDVAGIGEA